MAGRGEEEDDGRERRDQAPGHAQELNDATRCRPVREAIIRFEELINKANHETVNHHTVIPNPLPSPLGGWERGPLPRPARAHGMTTRARRRTSPPPSFPIEGRGDALSLPIPATHARARRRTSYPPSFSIEGKGNVPLLQQRPQGGVVAWPP